jgi:hypothetical protein
MIENEDRVVKVIEFGSADEASDMELAMYIGDLLQKEYPNHPWVVSFQGRGLILRHLSIASEVSRVIGKDGFASLLPRESLGNPKEIRQSVVKFAGELLEAFSLPRGAWDGRPPVVPDWRHKQDGNFT